jgi:hypothetical protein
MPLISMCKYSTVLLDFVEGRELYMGRKTASNSNGA